MPIYEYECTQCGNVEEVIQKFSDEPLTECTHCSGKLQKLVSHSSFHLKGTGWYVTDYANPSKKEIAAAKKDSGASSGKDKKSTAPEKKIKSTNNT